MLCALRDRFWWPSLANDVGWYIETCHKCQIWQTAEIRIPVAAPATLFHKAYVGTMFMPHALGYRYIVQYALCLQLRSRTVAERSPVTSQ